MNKYIIKTNLTNIIIYGSIDRLIKTIETIKNNGFKVINITIE